MRFNIHLALAFIFFAGLPIGPGNVIAQHPAFEERVAERQLMVKNGIENYSSIRVKNKAVLDAMRHVPRHVFMPEEVRQFAYENRPLPIGYNQTISQPFIVAHMTELLELDAAHKVLEIGTGSGYQAAILAELCDAVYSIEILPPLAERAALVLKKLAYDQVRVRLGDGFEGWPEEAPFDRIIVTCAPDDIPEALVEQLTPDGRIIIPVGNPHQIQYLVLVRKNRKGKVVIEKQYPVRFVPMTGRD